MKEYIIDILAIAASISTIIAAIAALITLRHLTNDKNEKLEYEVRKAFYEGGYWTNEGEVRGNNDNFLELIIEPDSRLHSFSGEIDGYAFNDTVYFHFEESNKRVITLDLFEMAPNQMYIEGECVIRSLGKATVKYITPELFTLTLTFIDDCMPKLPREMVIFTWAGASRDSN